MDIIKYYLGADGGGTKTDLVLTDISGKVLRMVCTAGTNPNYHGMEQAAATLCDGMRAVSTGFDPAEISVTAGIAGAGADGTSDRLAKAMSALGFARVRCTGDGDSIMAAGLGGGPGLISILGTGFVVFGRDVQGKGIRVSGWGSLFDEGGSGWKIGRDGLYAAYCDADGSGPACPILRALVEDKLGNSVENSISRLYREKENYIASFSPLVLRAARQGDGTATDILRRNMDNAAHMIAVGMRRLPEDMVCRVVLAGGLMQSADQLLPLLEEALREQAPGRRVQLQRLATRPVYGALLNAGLDSALPISAELLYKETER